MSAAQGRAGSGLLDRLRSGMNFSFGGGRSAVGLSIGASSVKVTELKKKKKSVDDVEVCGNFPRR